ncbi:MAG: peptidoglycan editing factor PgeF [Cytophagaceae bacterium]|nr:peptidoglycan editing factor PgeF [Cytophagaceae bacterium]MBP6092831.1 peptidoglycan editing factor PgeF [Cytophagaceae bacterium]
MTHSRVVRPQIFSHIPQLVAGISTRHGGVSSQAFQSLNLGVHTDDDPSSITQNLSLFCSDLGITPESLARSYQVHGSEIWTSVSPCYESGYDAIITPEPGIFAGVGIADCCPILLADPVQETAAAIHAGWKGTVAQIVHKTASTLIAGGSNPSDILAYIGPCISLAHFEVGDEVAEQFELKEQRGARWHVDLKAENAAQLHALGVTQIEISEYCTVANNDVFYSHRKEQGITGRMLAVIGFQRRG